MSSHRLGIVDMILWLSWLFQGISPFFPLDTLHISHKMIYISLFTYQ